MTQKLIDMAVQKTITVNTPWFARLTTPQRREIADAIQFSRSPEGQHLSKIALCRAIIEKFQLKIRPQSIADYLGGIPHGKEAEIILGKNTAADRSRGGTTPAKTGSRQAATRKTRARNQDQG